jgi:hypothetical protein
LLEVVDLLLQLRKLHLQIMDLLHQVYALDSHTARKAIEYDLPVAVFVSDPDLAECRIEINPRYMLGIEQLQ